MNIGELIKNLFKAIIPAGILWFVLGFCIGFVVDFNTINEDVFTALVIIIYIISYTILVTYFYKRDAKKSTCPRCKMPFVFYEKRVGSETLSEDYISQDVKGSDGIYRRRSYKVGKARYYYEAKCKECGYTKERQSVSNFKEAI